MEDIHGVDVSWIQHSQRERNHRPRQTPTDDGLSNLPAVSKTVSAPATPTKPAVPPKDGYSPSPSYLGGPAPAVPPKSNSHGSPTTPVQAKRPGLLHRSSREKISNQTVPIDTTRSAPRRSAASSWISSLSSKLSATPPLPTSIPIPSPGLPQQHGGPAASPTPTKAGTPLPSPGTPVTPSTPTEDTRPYVPQAPRSGGAGFFANALRRLSSSSQLGGTAGSRSGSASSPGGVVQRRVMNIDPNRTRCLLPELEPKKLRRVAFCVDVEIAGCTRAKEEQAKADERRRDEVKHREAEEGQALKNADGVAADDGYDKDEKTDTVDDEKVMSRKKEKKKRSEEERKERKEQKRRKAEESGSIPMQITLPTNSSSVSDLSGPSTPPRPIDRPTTDPLRIYRRCCQLRETPILKRITEQLAAPPSCPIGGPGVIMSLNLTGSRLQLADIVTLSDWLAIVPVRKLILEDSDLNDEAVRVILAGLLAAMTPDFTRISRALNRQSHEERSGMIEKLVLKNNPKITKEGWKHISLFLYMCKSLKSLDMSMNVFPKSAAGNRLPANGRQYPEPVEIFAKAIAERLGGNHFEELVMGECGLSDYQVRRIVDAVLISGVKRLGLADNNIGPEALEHVARYISSGACQGVDLAGNDIINHLDILGTAFKPDCPLWALSIADCNLDAKSLGPLFQGLINLQNLRFLDLSHNPDLFGDFTPTLPVDEELITKYPPSGLSILRKYLPALPALRRIHLNNVSMSPAQAIALADVLAECPHLAHLSILQNPSITALAGATTEELQEDAVALYASLMVAARVSHSIISIDVDVPTAENSEIVKALAKQVVAYCLRNMELYYSTVDDGGSAKSASTGTPSSDAPTPDVEMDVPEVILQLVGTSEGHVEAHPDIPAPDRDYIVGGTGVVKALNYCLLSQRRGSAQSTSGTASPPVGPINGRVIGAKLKNMSKNLLESARKIRARMQPALVREARGEDDMAFRRLLFLDNTLKAIIKRFEDEYPETRIASEPGTDSPSPPEDAPASPLSSPDPALAAANCDLAAVGDRLGTAPDGTYFQSDSDGSASDGEAGTQRKKRRDDGRPDGGIRSRQPSDVSLAAKKLAQEEGAVHRLGTEVRRKMLERASAAEAEMAEAAAVGAGGDAAAAEVAAAMIDMRASNEKEGRRSEEEDEIGEEHVRALKEKLRALDGAA